MQDLIEYGRPMRGWLGIEVQRLKPGALTDAVLAAGNGVVVTAVYARGPAAEAGLRPGDVLLQIDDQPVGDGHAGMNLIGVTRPGQKVKVALVRNGERRVVTITVGVRPVESGFPTQAAALRTSRSAASS
jgi:serine protease DegS